MNYKDEIWLKINKNLEEFDEKPVDIETHEFILEDFLNYSSEFLEILQSGNINFDLLHSVFSCFYNTNNFSFEDVLEESQDFWNFICSLVDKNDEKIIDLLLEFSQNCSLSYQIFKFTGIRDLLLQFTPQPESLQYFQKAVYCALKHINEYDEELIANLQSLVFQADEEEIMNCKLEGYSLAIYYLSKVTDNDDITPLLTMIQYLLIEKNIFSIIKAFHCLLYSSEKHVFELSTSEIMQFIISNIEIIPEEFLILALESIYKASKLSNISEFINSSLSPNSFLNLMDQYDTSDKNEPEDAKEFHSLVFQKSLSIICSLYNQETYFTSFHNNIIESAIFDCLHDHSNKIKEIAARSIFNCSYFYSSEDFDSFIEKGIMEEIMEYIEKDDTEICTLCINFLLESAKKSLKCRDFITNYFDILHDLYEKSEELDGNQSLYASLYFLFGFYEDLEISQGE